VYKVRGSNALWHHDGNEKLRPWGFYVHGCVDGHSRLIIYLACRANKWQATVAELFLAAVAEFGWPSRVRGDFGTENNEVERLMIAHWGILHRAYLRGRSVASFFLICSSVSSHLQYHSCVLAFVRAVRDFVKKKKNTRT
jgi:hypothetical protein